MSTTFAILTRDKKEDNFKRYDVAHRYSLGNKKIGIKWLNITLRDLLNIIVGTFLASFGKVIDFWFKHDKKKD